jgi:hypothetical protein
MMPPPIPDCPSEPLALGSKILPELLKLGHDLTATPDLSGQALDNLREICTALQTMITRANKEGLAVIRETIIQTMVARRVQLATPAIMRFFTDLLEDIEETGSDETRALREWARQDISSIVGA